jgi:AcrR family transcriptional regulator
MTTADATAAPVPTGAVVAKRRRADAERNQARVLEAARLEFAESGGDATLEAIARRAGVGIGTLYRHFPTRDALVEAAFLDVVEQSQAHAAELLESADPAAALAEFLREQLVQSATCRGLAAEAMIMMLDDACSAGSSPCDALREAGARLLARAQDAGTVRADADIDDLIRMVNAIGLATEDAPDGSASADRLFTLMIDGIRSVTPGRA